MRHKDWQTHARQEIVRNAAQKFFPKPRIAEGAGDHQIGAERSRLALQRIGDGARRYIVDPDCIGRDGMPPQMLNEALPRQGAVSVDKARWIDQDDGCPL